MIAQKKKLAPKKQDLKALQKEWYKKLQEVGFKDIESSSDYLKEWDSHYFQANYDPLSFEARQTYYQLADNFLVSYKFSSFLEFKIWELHTQGLSTRKIADELKLTHTPHCRASACDLFCPHHASQLYAVRLNKDKVSLIIRKLSTIMLAAQKSFAQGDNE